MRTLILLAVLIVGLTANGQQSLLSGSGSNPTGSGSALTNVFESAIVTVTTNGTYDVTEAYVKGLTSVQSGAGLVVATNGNGHYQTSQVQPRVLTNGLGGCVYYDDVFLGQPTWLVYSTNDHSGTVCWAYINQTILTNGSVAIKTPCVQGDGITVLADSAIQFKTNAASLFTVNNSWKTNSLFPSLVLIQGNRLLDINLSNVTIEDNGTSDKVYLRMMTGLTGGLLTIGVYGDLSGSDVPFKGGFFESDSGLWVQQQGGTAGPVYAKSFFSMNTASNLFAWFDNTGFHGNGASLTNVAGPSIQTNWVSGLLYTNTSSSDWHVRALATWTTAAATGDAEMDLRVGAQGGSLTRISGAGASTTVAVTLAQSYTNEIQGYINAGQVFTFTNTSAGAGNTAGLVSGTGQKKQY